MADTYWLKPTWSKKWKKVTKKRYISAERDAGFHPTTVAIDDPEYDNTCATGGFGNDTIEGEVRYG